jgi:hypothetical protein
MAAMPLGLRTWLAAMLTVLVFDVPMRANNDTWKNAVSGIWGVGTNWLDNTTPGTNDTATFNLGGIYTVTLDADAPEINGLTISNNSSIAFASNNSTRRFLTADSGDDSTDVLIDFSVVTLGLTPNRSIFLNAGANAGSSANDLTVQNQGVLNVKFGSVVNTADFLVTGGGQLFVVGAGSTLSTDLASLGNVNVNGTGGGALLAYSAGADGNLDIVSVQAGGVFALDTGATVTAIRLDVATGANSSGTVSINGSGSTLTMNGSVVNVGAASGTGLGTINIGTAASGGTFTTDVNSGMSVFTTGVVNVGSAANTGTLNNLGNLTINGGDVIVNAASSFLLASGKTTTVQSGGLLRFNGNHTTDANTSYVVTGAASRLEVPTGNFVHNGSLSATSGGVADIDTLTLNPTGAYTADTPAALLVDHLVVNGGTRTFGDGTFGMTIGQSATIQNAAQVSVTGNVAINNLDYTVTGGLSSLNVGGDVTIDAGTLTVASGGVFTFAGGRTMTIQNGGSASFAGSYTTAANGIYNITGAGSALLVPAGSLIINNGAQVSVTSGGVINPSGSVVAEDGTLNAGVSVNEQLLGTSAAATINVTASGISLGNAASFTGFSHEGTLSVGANTVTLSSAAYARLGVLTSISGGTINASSGVYLPGGGNLIGHGTITARVTGDSGSVIDATTGAMTLGNAASPAGFVFDGELRTHDHVVTLNSSGPATLGNLTTVGNGPLVAGTLNATNGFVVDFGNSLTGFGTVNSTNTSAKRAVINGTVEGNSPANPVTLTGYIKGVGTFNNVLFTGTFDPGLSSTIVNAGNLTLSPTSTLIMELGGTTPGSGHDQIDASGELAFDGIMQVALVNGFAPAIGQSFNLFNWSSASGSFDAINLPTLGASLAWDTSQLYVDGTLSIDLAGNFNHDGTVDAADYVVWRKNDGSQAGYDMWRANFGATFGSSPGADFANSTVPEPIGWLMLFIGMATVFYRRCAVFH